MRPEPASRILTAAYVVALTILAVMVFYPALKRTYAISKRSDIGLELKPEGFQIPFTRSFSGRDSPAKVKSRSSAQVTAPAPSWVRAASHSMTCARMMASSSPNLSITVVSLGRPRQTATALATANTSAGIGRWSFQVMPIGFSPEWLT